jgi:hypothetical protein
VRNGGLQYQVTTKRAVAADRARVTAFCGVRAARPARRLNVGVRRRRSGDGESVGAVVAPDDLGAWRRHARGKHRRARTTAGHGQVARHLPRVADRGGLVGFGIAGWLLGERRG